MLPLWDWLRQILSDPRIKSPNWIGSQLRIKPALMYSWMRHPAERQEKGGARNPLEQIEAFQSVFKSLAANDLEIDIIKPLVLKSIRDCLQSQHEGHAVEFIRDLAALAGMVAIKPTDDVGNAVIAETLKEFGEFIHEVTADNADGTITRDEWERIVREGDEAMACIQAVVLRGRKTLGTGKVIDLKREA